MKSTGMVRPIDQFGRVVIPKEIRKNLSIEIGTQLEIFVDNNRIVLQKYQRDAYTPEELREALIMVCKETGKDPMVYLQK
ncbi:AbrB/MazE/SpoVT family DNA-binding domain-containing protein [Clostridium merdae]|uniref:AbrB/MazE/SpoVT family DNA-binding domain-containing protein n=1 Tax=Clostridium merdae TaxID=1958780 RepID=UPI000A270530|nr:AbrB/MazE/SpoVT family DNA-binding domain-containing protein [Clostridium merdae]